jgi:perosamine synthetase
MIPVNRPAINNLDIEFVSSVLRETYISGDTPIVKQMEENLASTVGTKFAIAVNSGTSAIDLVVEALELDENCEVVVPTFTIISTVSHLIRRKARLKLVDADEETWSMNSAEAAEVISASTKAVIPVHIYGLPVDMDNIMSVSNHFNIPVIEDSAEALGLEYKGTKCGSIGRASTFSFYANKIVTGGEGGAICTNDIGLDKKLRSLRNLCHSEAERFVHNEIGYNFRLPGLAAALIHNQLLRLPDLVQQKIEIAERYERNLIGHPWFNFHASSTSFAKNIYWVFGIILNSECPHDAKELQEILHQKGVGTRRFFCPIHLQPIAKDHIINIGDRFPVAENLWNRGLYLPSGLGNTNEEIDAVSEILWEMVK